MKHTKDDNTWLTIRANCGQWFAPNTLKFFGSRIYWHTLTETNGGYLFITSEDNFDRTEKRYSVRFVNADFGIQTLGKFLDFDSLADAKMFLNGYNSVKVWA